jgi:hypothetical protein
MIWTLRPLNLIETVQCPPICNVIYGTTTGTFTTAFKFTTMSMNLASQVAMSIATATLTDTRTLLLGESS